MKLTSDEQKTVDYYNNYGDQWTNRETYTFWQEEPKTFKKYLPKGKVIEVGSGGGRDAKNLIDAGYEYVGTDISEGLLEIARKNNPGVTFIQKSIYNLDFIENSFDGFWVAATLLHIPKSRIDEALQSIHRIVKSEGIGFVTMKKGVGEKAEKAAEGGERFFSYYSQNEFQEVLERNRFKILSNRIWEKSEKTTWLIYFVKVEK